MLKDFIVRSHIDDEKIPWEEYEPGPGDPPGQCGHVLCEEPRTGATTHLAKFSPGYTGKSREWHSVAQEFFLLEGDLSQPGIELQAPAYLYIPAGKIHGPFSSKNGAVYLYKFDAPFDINYCEEEG